MNGVGEKPLSNKPLKMRMQFGTSLTNTALGGILICGVVMAQHTSIVSIASDGTLADADCHHAVVTSTGRYVAYHSRSTNLINGISDALNYEDVFLRDRLMGTTVKVSVAIGGGEANENSTDPVISQDGRYLAFNSFASDLVSQSDATGTSDVFLRDLQSATTVRLTTGTGHSSGQTISADGRIIAFWSGASDIVPGDGNGVDDVFIFDRITLQVTRITDGNNNSYGPCVSPDGNFVAFVSDATNLVSPPTTLGIRHVYMFDRAIGTIELVSVSSAGNEADGSSGQPWKPSVSTGGRYVVFESDASNLVLADTNGVPDVFRRDRLTGTTTCISMSTSGAIGDGGSYDPSISGSGRFVAFRSEASNFVVGDVILPGTDDLDVFVHDCVDQTTELVSLATAGEHGNYYSSVSSISFNGRFVVFESKASNIDMLDTNGVIDIFFRDRDPWPENPFLVK